MECSGLNNKRFRWQVPPFRYVDLLIRERHSVEVIAEMYGHTGDGICIVCGKKIALVRAVDHFLDDATNPFFILEFSPRTYDAPVRVQDKISHLIGYPFHPVEHHCESSTLLRYQCGLWW